MATKTTSGRLRIVPPAARSGLQQAVSDYLAHITAKGGSPRTADYYESTLRTVFLPWCAAEKVTAPEQLSQRLLDRLNTDLLGRVSEQTGKPLSRATVATYLRAVSQFIRWTQREKGINPDDIGVMKVQRVTVPRRILDTLSREEVADLEAAATAERDKVIIRLLGDGGLRLTELLTLTTGSLHEQGRERYLKVTGKGARDRLVPVLPSVYARLQRFAKLGRPAEANSERIFVSLRRRPSGDYEALDPRAVQQMIKAAARRAGLKKPVHPHLLRHSMATNFLRGGGNPVTLAKILGHRDLTMIQSVYSHLNNSDAHQEMMRILRKED